MNDNRGRVRKIFLIYLYKLKYITCEFKIIFLVNIIRKTYYNRHLYIAFSAFCFLCFNILKVGHLKVLQ